MTTNKCISINFAEGEYEKLRKAAAYTTLNDASLVRILIKKNINAAKTKGFLEFNFPMNRKVEQGCYRSKAIQLSPEDYREFSRIRDCVTLTTSNLIKYWIMPELEQIIENKGWEAEK
ncbi:hypothetical protein H8Z76_13130 [Roseburia sp. BX0805]|uniref:Uncharacterized protein n=1 Tax=Roseburia yibonii TaxID=2763063 RepID=A0ABR7IDI4_9FIRM|nr:hypothetical protein [Roseburia yibonii]MBC5754926.1 hypothetical protein [Roseburia yibonii]